MAPIKMHCSNFGRNGHCAKCAEKHTTTDDRRLTSVAYGPGLPVVGEAGPDASWGGAANVRQTAAPCPQLRYGLTEQGGAAIDAPDPEPTLMRPA